MNARFALILVASTILVLVVGPATGATRPVRLVVDGSPVASDVPPLLIDGRVLVPLRWVAEALDCEVSWDEATWTAEVRTRTRGPWVRPVLGFSGHLLVVPGGYLTTTSLVPARNPLLGTETPPGKVYLVLTLVLINTGGGAWSCNPQHVFRLEAAGVEYRPDYWAQAFSLERPLDGELAPGAVVEGQVAFVVPHATRCAVLGVRGPGREELTFTLELR